MEEELSHVSHAQLSFIFVEILHKHLKQQQQKKNTTKKQQPQTANEMQKTLLSNCKNVLIKIQQKNE